MTIDVLSLIIGAIIWELLSKYISLFIAPKFRRKGSKKKANDVNNKNISQEYKDANVGFKGELKDEL